MAPEIFTEIPPLKKSNNEIAQRCKVEISSKQKSSCVAQCLVWNQKYGTFSPKELKKCCAPALFKNKFGEQAPKSCSLRLCKKVRTKHWIFVCNVHVRLWFLTCDIYVIHLIEFAEAMIDKKLTKINLWQIVLPLKYVLIYRFQKSCYSLFLTAVKDIFSLFQLT